MTSAALKSIDGADDLPHLTEKQTKFVEGILKGKTASDAYRAAYDCDDSQNSTIWVRASELRANRNVAVWLSMARKAGLGHATVTLEGHLQELERLREIAVENKEVSAAIQAEKSRGQAAGLYVERHEVTHFDPADTIRAIADLSPDVAKMLAQQIGLELTDQRKPEPVTIEHEPSNANVEN